MIFEMINFSHRKDPKTLVLSQPGNRGNKGRYDYTSTYPEQGFL